MFPAALRPIALAATLAPAAVFPALPTEAAREASAWRRWAPGIEDRLERFEGIEPHMGTLVRITVYARDAETARAAFRAGFNRISELDAILSDYKTDSELNRVTRDAVARPVVIGPDLFAVLRASYRLSVETNGAFDVTQGPVVRLWREARTTGRVPDPDALRAAARRSGYRHMHLDEVRRTVRFDIADMQLDVGANGKGYAASEALTAIARAGVPIALVAVSGDIACGAPPPGQPGWRVRIHDDGLEGTEVPAVVRLSHMAVSTSGNAEQHLDVEGRRYSHVIDPRSRAGLLDDITVTVIAPHGLDADGLDTAIGVLGVDKGLALIDRHPDAAAFIVLRDAGTTTVRPSSRLRAMVGGTP